jgi:AraC-like DNA-binding protein
MAKLFIKYMVSLRCKMLVRDELARLGIHAVSIDLGLVELLEALTKEQHQELSINLLKSGLVILDDKRAILVERIKNVVVEMIHYNDDPIQTNYSDYIAKKLGYEYSYLSSIFSKVKGITLQQFIILHKIERVKELLMYDELNLKEISYKLNYSSVAHLSNQFKKITGLTPTFFKQLGLNRRQNLENL